MMDVMMELLYRKTKMTPEEKVKRSLSRLIDGICQLNEKFITMTPKQQDAFIAETVRGTSSRLLKDLFGLEPLVGNLRTLLKEKSKQDGGETGRPKEDKENTKSKKEIKCCMEVKEKEEPLKLPKEPKQKKEPKLTKVQGELKEPKEVKEPKKSKEPKEPKPKVSIPSYIKTLVWNQYVGEDMPRTRCLCCKKTWITYQGFHCGHVIAEAKGGDTTVVNLRPICAGCNLAMKTENMHDFAKRFFGHEIGV
jgi:hypothetical protein